jgi:hypothetical protein
MTKPTYDQLAEDFDLWQEYVDPNATVSEAELKAMSIADRMALIIEMFGPEDRVPTVDEILESTAVGNGFHDWGVEGGTVRVSRAQLLPALEAAYDPSMPDWPVMVDIDA